VRNTAYFAYCIEKVGRSIAKNCLEQYQSLGRHAEDHGLLGLPWRCAWRCMDDVVKNGIESFVQRVYGVILEIMIQVSFCGVCVQFALFRGLSYEDACYRS
jgi:hypothetical protein